MKIAIDCSQVIYGIGSSVYTKNLVASLLRLDQTNEYLLFGGSLRRQSDLYSFFDTLDKTKIKRVLPISPSIADFLWNRLHVLPIEQLIGSIDVLHSSDWAQPPSRAYRVTTVHDMSPILFAKATHPKIVAVHARRLEWVKKEVDRIIAPSKATKKDLINFGIAESKIQVIYEAPDPYFKPSVKDEVELVKEKFGIKDDYFLSIGVSERKNTIRIAEAFSRFNKHGQFKLIIVGRPIEQLALSGRDIIFTNHIDNSDLRALYSGAKALIYPSLYEGFGLPILEAFGCGCPVITSNISSMAEVASNAAILVDPYQVESIASAMKIALTQASVLKKKGSARLKEFSWQKAAAETLKVYKQKA